MTTTLRTYTTPQALIILGLTNMSAFHALRLKYPAYFVQVEKDGPKEPAKYDADKLDKFQVMRNRQKLLRAQLKGKKGI
jgi:hypothetical protein